MADLNELTARIKEFKGDALKDRLEDLQKKFNGQNMDSVQSICSQNDIDDKLLHSAIVVKNVSSQIAEVVHATGILLLLPQILESGEIVESLSLGAGNTGKSFDLETNKRIAEFKFIHWKGGSESIRQNSLFKDFFYLAENDIKKKRYLYLIGLTCPLSFLEGGRAIPSVLKERKLATDFNTLYGERFSVVREYYSYRKNLVELIDMEPLLPSLNHLVE